MTFVAHPLHSLVFIHFCIPHPPYVAGPPGEDRKAGYLRNLEIFDDTLGMIRDKMIQTGVWNHSAILLTSDHGYRNDEQDEHSFHVPFILKMPEQTQMVRFDGAFNTVVAKHLVLSILDGKTRTAEDAFKFLKSHSVTQKECCA
jgi:hypothetical protein